MKSLNEYITLIEAATVSPSQFPQGYDSPEASANARVQQDLAKQADAAAKQLYPVPQDSSWTAADRALHPSADDWQIAPNKPLQMPAGGAGTQKPAQQPAQKQAPKKPAFVDQGKQFGYNTPEEVQQIQNQLLSMGYDLGPTGADGKFGPKTLAAYKQAYSQMYGQQPGSAPASNDTLQQQTGVTARAVAGPNGSTTYTNAPQGGTLPPAAAPNAEKQGLLDKAAELTKAGDVARAKIYTDAAARMNESTDLDRIKSLINYK